VNDEELYRKSLAKWGRKRRIMHIAEEASELSVACMHYLREDRDNNLAFNNLAEEIADVSFVLDELRYTIPEINELIEQYKTKKKKALAKILEEEKTEKNLDDFKRFMACDDEKLILYRTKFS
jgi:phosphoribosyl-ATP pyrophosphohydrolase